jgi:hypothetical protein
MQFRKYLTITYVALAGLIAHTASYADSDKTNLPNLKESASYIKDKCGYEIKKFCSTVTPGEGRIASCLDSKENQLSNTCKNAWMGVKANISKRMDRAEVQFRKDCGGDVQMFCSDVPSGKGRLLSCLKQNESGLSQSCKNFQAKLDKKLGEFLG